MSARTVRKVQRVFQWISICGIGFAAAALILAQGRLCSIWYAAPGVAAAYIGALYGGCIKKG